MNGIPVGIDEVANSGLVADCTRCELINEVTVFIEEVHELQEDKLLDITKCCGPKGAKTMLVRSSQCEAFQSETTFDCSSDEILLDEDRYLLAPKIIKTICEFDTTK